MNNYITYNARAKFRRLLESAPGALAIKLVSGKGGGFEVRTLFSRDSHCDIIISMNPPVLVGPRTLGVLKAGSIDFDYKDQEFIITRDNPHVVSANTR